MYSSNRNLTQLQRLYINNNQLEVLLNDTFAGLVSLSHLDLSNNKISLRSSSKESSIPRGVPAPVQQSGNVGTESNPLVISWIRGDNGVSSDDRGRETAVLESQSKLKMYHPFKGLTMLQHLDLSNNGIRYLMASQWKDMQQLVTLSLMHNNVQEWYDMVFSNLSSLSELMLSYNSMSLVTVAMIQDFSLPSLTAVNLLHNAFQCDCSLSKLNASINTSIFMDFSSYSCSQEGHDLSLEEFLSTAICPLNVPLVVDDHDNGKLEMILISVSLFMLVICSVTIYRKRW